MTVKVSLQSNYMMASRIVPHDSLTLILDLYDEYKTVRGSVGLSKNDLLPIDAQGSNQICRRFGLHPNLPFVKTLYDEDDVAFFAGVGVLSEPVTKDDYWMKTKTQLFAHNTSKFICTIKFSLSSC